MRRLGTAAAVVVYLLAVSIGMALAQEGAGGQFCVRSFEDTNANELFDTETERLITRGISVDLMGASGVVMGSALLDKSPNASYGIICFYDLSPGDYSVLMSSADYIATTERLVTQPVSGSAPTIIEFGARRVGSLSPVAVPGAGTAASGFSPRLGDMTLMRVAVAVVGAAVLMLFFMVFGFLIYSLRTRQRAPQPVSYQPDSVARFEPVEVYDQYGAAPIDEPPISSDDTNPSHPVN